MTLRTFMLGSGRLGDEVGVDKQIHWHMRRAGMKAAPPTAAPRQRRQPGGHVLHTAAGVHEGQRVAHPLGGRPGDGRVFSGEPTESSEQVCMSKSNCYVCCFSRGVSSDYLPHLLVCLKIRLIVLASGGYCYDEDSGM